ncbi:MAG: hypothetical protein K2G75_06585, partial [Muribaculaceae bacterium]|nr:hypothetical protein [Muribaculaceae bacterium]
MEIPHTADAIPVKNAYRRRLSEMLDLTYELEGLLQMGATRPAVPARLNQLIVNKINAIVALADAPATPEETAEIAAEATAPVAEAAPAPEETSEVATEAAPAPEETSEAASEAAPAQEDESE